LSFLIAAFALELGQGLTGLYHHRGWLTASTTLPYDFRRQFYDWLGSRCHGLISLNSELGFAKRNRSPSFCHRKNHHLGRAILPTHFVNMRILLPDDRVNRQIRRASARAPAATQVQRRPCASNNFGPHSPVMNSEGDCH
jgi:hypothetical protein